MKDIKESIKKVFDSKKVFMVASVFGALVISTLIFQAGVFVGFHKASFGRDWGENYGRNFGMMRGDMGPIRGGIINPENFPNGNGAVGKIIKIELPTIIVQDKDGTEKIVLIKDDTSIRSMREDITKDKLKIDDAIVVVGSPNNKGQIEAKLIRLMPVGIPNFLEQPVAPTLAPSRTK
jgi:hypothetical protein